MTTKIRALVLSLLSIQLALHAAEPYKPKRINKAVELLEQGQPVYYTTSSGGGYDEGRKLAKTWADYINYEMEHGAFDISALRAFMKGLVDAGPTRSGHRTPAVIVTLPVVASDEATRARQRVDDSTSAGYGSAWHPDVPRPVS